MRASIFEIVVYRLVYRAFRQKISFVTRATSWLIPCEREVKNGKHEEY